MKRRRLVRMIVDISVPADTPYSAAFWRAEVRERIRNLCPTHIEVDSPEDLKLRAVRALPRKAST